MISLRDARSILLDGVEALPVERLPLPDCRRRVLGAAVEAPSDQPPFPVSAMDGYAIRAEDARHGARLRIIGEAPAGKPFGGEVRSGETVRIATGGVVPEGCDRVAIQEEVERRGDEILLSVAPTSGVFVRGAGCDFRKGELLLRQGQMLGPAQLGLGAAANCATMEVHRRPRVMLFPSGDELCEPGAARGPGGIVNSAAYALEAMIEEWGGAASRQPILSDDLESCQAAIASRLGEADLLVTLGGASVGDRDSLRPCISRMGAQLLFEKVAVMPGKPTWHARFPRGPLVLGLPGNPASAFVCALLFLRPLLFQLTGQCEADAEAILEAISLQALPAAGNRETFLRARVSVGAGGRLVAEVAARQDSSLLTPLAASNALLRRKAGAPPLEPGANVEILLFGDIAGPPVVQAPPRATG
jgi:molybdopterin molybdotransferase